MYPYYQQPLQSPSNYYQKQNFMHYPPDPRRVFQPLSPIMSPKMQIINQDRNQYIYSNNPSIPSSPKSQNIFSPRFEQQIDVRHPSLQRNFFNPPFYPMIQQPQQEFIPYPIDRRMPMIPMKPNFVKNGETMIRPIKPINNENRKPKPQLMYAYSMDLEEVYRNQPRPNHRVDQLIQQKNDNRIFENRINENRILENRNDNSYLPALQSERKRSMEGSPNESAISHFKSEPDEVLTEIKPANKIVKKVARKAVKLIAEKSKKSKALARIRVLAWAMAYPKLLYHDVKNKCIDKKENKGHEAQEKFELLIEKSEDFILRVAKQEILNMLNDKENDFNFAGAKKSAKTETMGDALASHVKLILNKIINSTRRLPKEYFQALAELSEHGCYIPDNYFTEFEMKRIQFSHFGNLKHTLSWHSKVIIAGIVVFRGFLLSLLWYGSFVQEYKEKNFKKLLNIVSFLYNVSIEYVRNIAATQKGNKDNIAKELQVSHAAHLSATNEEARAKYKIKKENTRDLELIEGLYGKSQMETIFCRKELVDSVRVLIDCWLDLLYEQSHEEWNNMQLTKKRSKSVKFKTNVFDF